MPAGFNCVDRPHSIFQPRYLHPIADRNNIAQAFAFLQPPTQVAAQTLGFGLDSVKTRLAANNQATQQYPESYGVVVSVGSGVGVSVTSGVGVATTPT